MFLNWLWKECWKDWEGLVTSMTKEEYYEYRKCHAYKVRNHALLFSLIPIITYVVMLYKWEMSSLMEYSWINYIMLVFISPVSVLWFWYLSMKLLNYSEWSYAWGFVCSCLINIWIIYFITL